VTFLGTGRTGCGGRETGPTAARGSASAEDVWPVGATTSPAGPRVITSWGVSTIRNTAALSAATNARPASAKPVNSNQAPRCGFASEARANAISPKDAKTPNHAMQRYAFARRMIRRSTVGFRGGTIASMTCSFHELGNACAWRRPLRWFSARLFGGSSRMCLLRCAISPRTYWAATPRTPRASPQNSWQRTRLRSNWRRRQRPHTAL